MKRILCLLCALLCVLGMVTAVGATPIAEGESVTWHFDISALEGHFVNSIKWSIFFGADFLHKDEGIEYGWWDEYDSTAPIAPTVVDDSRTYSAGGLMTVSDFGAWMAYDPDIYLRVKMNVGSVDVVSANIEGGYVDDRAVWIVVAASGNPVNTVPDASIMLLLSSSLMGLAVLSRKSKRTG